MQAGVRTSGLFLVQYHCSFVLVQPLSPFFALFGAISLSSLCWCKSCLLFSLFGAITLSPGANWSFCLNFLVQYPFLLCAGASRLAPSPPIWSWPSLQWVAFLSLHCAMCIGTHPPCYNVTTVSYSCTLYWPSLQWVAFLSL